MNFLGGTINPLGTAAGLRPGTTMRPGSQMRPGTGRNVQVAGIGGSLQQPVAVTAEAPVAREGMRAASRAGVGTSAGPGRQVGDRSYYIGVLRPKIAELAAEIERLNEQEELINKSSGVLSQLQLKCKTVNEEITKLKASLADVNFAVENSTTRDSRSIKEESTALEKQNALKRKEVDALFLAVKETESKTKATSAALEEATEQLDRRILDENQDYGMYKAAREEAAATVDALLERQHEVRTLAAKQELLMSNLSKDPDKKRAVGLLRNILRKRREKDELSAQCALSVETEKQMLLKQIRTTRSDIEVLERQVNEARDALQESRVRLSALDEEAKSYSGENIKAFQELQEKEREMQAFLDDYPDRDRAEVNKITELQKNITGLLTRIAQALELQRQMPAAGSATALKALNNEVDARRDQIRNDQKTHERLEKELLDRKAELDKVGVLDRKITEELKSHTDKMAQQKAEIAQYGDLDGLREQIEQLRQNLSQQKTYLTRVRDGGVQLLNKLSATYEEARKKAQEDDIFTSLATQEQKLRMLWQSTYTLEDFVRLKEKETQYVSTKAACLRLVDEANLVLKEPSRLTGMSGPPVLHLQEG